VIVGAVVLGYDKIAIDRGDRHDGVHIIRRLGSGRCSCSRRSLCSSPGGSRAHWTVRADAGRGRVGSRGSDEPVPDLRLPVLGEEIARGIPGFIERSGAAAAALAGNPTEAGAMKNLQRRLVLLVSGILVAAAAFVSYRAGERFEHSLTQQRLGMTQEIGRSVAVVIEKALTFGVPFDQLVDTERFLDAVKRDNPGVDYIIITTPDGQLRYSTDLSSLSNLAGLRGSLAAWDGRERSMRIGRYFNTATAINGKGRHLGWLHLGERANVIEQLLRDIVFDILTVLVGRDAGGVRADAIAAGGVLRIATACHA